MTNQHFPESWMLGSGEAEITPSSSPVDSTAAHRILQLRLQQLLGGARLSAKGVSRLSNRITNRFYAAGEVIVRHGEQGDFMAVVSSGQVAVTLSPDLEPLWAEDLGQPAAVLLPGSTLGEAMLINSEPSATTLLAHTDVEICVLYRADFQILADQRSSWSVRPGSRWRRWFLPVGLAALVALSVIVFSVGLVLQFRLDHSDGQQVTLLASAKDSDAVQITEPRNGQVLQRSPSIPVRAFLIQPGLHLAELQVDGSGRGVQANHDPDTSPWMVEWEWEGASEGAHRLAIQAKGSGGDWLVSEPITVTVVPLGMLAFATNRDGPQSIYTMSTDGRTLNRVVAGPGDTRQPAWGRDTELAYVADSEIGKATIRQMLIDASEVRDLVVGRDPAWSADGVRLAYAATVDSVSQVHVVMDDGVDPIQVTSESVYAGQPTWSPDGREVAIVADRDGNWDIWLASLDNGDLYQLTDDPAMDWAPAWSPDGSQLAFVSDRGGSHQIHIMRRDGSGIRPLTDLARGAEAPAWSPDGFWLAFVAYTGHGEGINAREIHLMRADGQDQVRITYNSFDDTQPDWRRRP